MHHNNNSLFADYAARKIIELLQAMPGTHYLGEMPIRAAITEPAPTFLLHARLRHAIEKRLSANE